MASTDTSIAIYGVAISTIRDVQIREAWNCFDFMPLYLQIGLLPMLPDAK